MKGVMSKTALLGGILLALLLLAAGCGSGEGIESLPEATGGFPPEGPVILSTKPPLLTAVNATVTISATLSGEPGDTLSFDVTSGGGSFTGLPGTVTLDGSGQGSITVTYTASATPGTYTHTLTVTDGGGMSISGGFNTKEVPPMGTLLNTLVAPASQNTALAFDGVNLLVHNRNNGTLYEMNPGTGAVLGTLVTGIISANGMGWDGAHLWIGEVSVKNLRQVDKTTGNVLQLFTPPVAGNYISGISWDGSHFWVSVTSSGVVERVDSGWNPVSSLPKPGGSLLRGSTAAGGVVFVSEGNCAATVYKMAKDTGAVLGSFPAAGGGCPDLAFDGTSLWVGDFGSSNLYKYSPGTVLAP